MLATYVENTLGVLAQRGPASNALVVVVREALAKENADAAETGRQPLTHRQVCLAVMKNFRAAMSSLRDELDSMEGIGKYA
jgi:hypothetical protein